MLSPSLRGLAGKAAHAASDWREIDIYFYIYIKKKENRYVCYCLLKFQHVCVQTDFSLGFSRPTQTRLPPHSEATPVPGGLEQPWLGGTTLPPAQRHFPVLLPPGLLIPACQDSFGLGGSQPWPPPPRGPLTAAAQPRTPCSAHTCIYFYSFSHFFCCHLCKYQLSSDTKKLLTLYKCHIYIIYKNTLFSIFV